MKKTLPLLILPFLLSSCGSHPQQNVNLDLNYVSTNKVPVTDIDSIAQQNLLKTANSVDAEMNRLAQLKLSGSNLINNKQQSTAPNMSRKFSIHWSGPMMPVIKQVAYYSKYDIKIDGHAPTTPIIINLDMNNQPLVDIIQNIRYQVFNAANIQLETQNNPMTILITYKNN
jgi:hypothetical protein